MIAQVVLAALLLRGLFLAWGLYHSGGALIPAGDAWLYDALARALLAGQGLSLWGRPSAYAPPGYPLFLAALYRLAGPSALAVALAQALLGALSAGIVASIGRRLYGERAGRGAGLLAAAYPHLVLWTRYQLTETLFVFLLLAALWLLTEAELSRGRAFVGGLSLGLAALVRPVLLPYLPVAALGARRGGAAVSLGLGALVALGPWTARNGRALGLYTPGTTESAFVLWQGNSHDATGGTRGYVDARDFRRLPVPPEIDEVRRERAYREAVWAYVGAEPQQVLRRAPAKLWNMWRPVYAGASARNWLVNGGSYLLLLLAALGPLWRERRPAARPLQALLLTLTLLHALVTGMIRFRLPLEAVLCVFAGAGLARLRQAEPSQASRGDTRHDNKTPAAPKINV